MTGYAAQLVVGFAAMLGVAAAYYVAARLLAPRPRRRGDAALVYGCGERWGPVDEAEAPYPWAVLLLAAFEAVPVAAFVYGGVDAALLLLLASFLVLVAGREAARG